MPYYEFTWEIMYFFRWCLSFCFIVSKRHRITIPRPAADRLQPRPDIVRPAAAVVHTRAGNIAAQAGKPGIHRARWRSGLVIA